MSPYCGQEWQLSLPQTEWSDWEYKTETHISYQNPDEVKYAFLSDRFHFPGYTYSIGDALMIIFGISCLCMYILVIINVKKCDKLL